MAITATIRRRVTEDRVSVPIPSYGFPHSIIDQTKVKKGQQICRHQRPSQKASASVPRDLVDFQSHLRASIAARANKRPLDRAEQSVLAVPLDQRCRFDLGMVQIGFAPGPLFVPFAEIPKSSAVFAMARVAPYASHEKSHSTGIAQRVGIVALFQQDEGPALAARWVRRAHLLQPVGGSHVDRSDHLLDPRRSEPER